MPLPIAHSAVGLTAYFTLPRNQREKLLWPKRSLLVLGIVFLANAADLDFLPGLITGHPNRFHHGASHSLSSVILISVGAWFIFRNYFREIPQTRFLVLLLASSLSHPLLDIVSSDTSFPFGIPLFWPFSSDYFISPFPLFRDVNKAGESNSVFFQSLLSANNGWGVVLEITFSVIILSALLLYQKHAGSWRSWLIASGLLGATLFYYGLQIEPNWLEIKEHSLINSKLSRPVSLVHLSDLHLSRLSFREKALKKILLELNPDILVFSGDTFDPIRGQNPKIILPFYLNPLVDYIDDLPGEKFLVWGEGEYNSRHLLSKELTKRGISVLEDESQTSSNFPEISITGKLPELAIFELIGNETENKFLSAGPTELNSYLHFIAPDEAIWPNYDFTGSLCFSEFAGVGLTFYSHYNRFSDIFYRIRLTHDLSLELAPHGPDAANMSGKCNTTMPLQAANWYNFRIRCQTLTDRTEIKSRFWPRELSEPETWHIDCQDSSSDRLIDGTIGIWVNGPQGEKLFDNFQLQNLRDDTLLIKEEFNLVRDWRRERFFGTRIEPAENWQYNILLSHSPEIINHYSIENFDLLVSGDTHGGQICWPNGKPILKNKYLPVELYSGLHNFEKTKININRGIGTSIIPLRFFCRPEITLIKLKPI